MLDKTPPLMYARLEAAITKVPGVNAAYVTWDKDLAELQLSDVAPNRKLKAAKVDGMARDHESDNFLTNGESVIIDDQGRLIDGEHRLRMIARTGKPAVILTTWGISSAVRSTIDTGTSRSLSDILTLMGQKYGSDLSATIRRIEFYRTGTMKSRVVTEAEALVMITKYPGIIDSVRACHTSSIVPRAMLSALHCLVSHYKANHGFLDFFVPTIINGQCDDGAKWLGATDPAYCFREYLIKNKKTQSGDSKWLGLLHAWNLFVNGEGRTVWKVPRDVDIVALPPSLLET